ncbi:MAG: hypothetical protein V4563_03580 [Pseudomonadota bacterium]
MVVGFLLGGAGVVVGGTLLNQLFGIALANAQFDSVTGLCSVIVYLALYVSLCLNLVHSCFNLIFIVPDQVINWVGGHGVSTAGREINDQVKHALAGFGGKMEHALDRNISKGSRSGKSGPRSGDGIKG